MTQFDSRDASFFVAGGALPLDAPAYIQRPVDALLLQRLLAGQDSVLLAPPQTGKSSLMLRLVRALQEQGVKSTIIYLSGLANSAGPEQWYTGLLVRLAFQLKLPVKAEEWWQAQAPLEPARRFTTFLEEALLPALDGPLVIFFDELETLLPLPFAADFLAAVQKLETPVLTVALLGRPVLGKSMPPGGALFPAGQLLDLPDFSRAELQPLADYLVDCYPEEGEIAFNRIFYWSGGQPYLTQRLALALSQLNQSHWSAAGVDRLVERLFSAPGESEEPHLQLIRASVEASPRRRKLLALAQRLGRGQIIPEQPHASEQQELKHLGLVQGVEGELHFRNPLYRRAFQPKATRTLKAGWWQPLALAALLLLLVVVGAISLTIYWQQQSLAAEARRLAEMFRHAPDAETRLESLAGLINLPGYRGQARELFYQELSAPDRLLLFDLADPQAVGSELLLVTQDLYSSPALAAEARDNELLQAMSRPLDRLGDSMPAAIDLELAISQWLKGREYQAQGAYPEALEAYNTALDLDERQAGIYFDRGMVHVALNEPAMALANFENALRLDPSWQERVQGAVLENELLYTGVWQDTTTYITLAGLLPTPTPTSTPAAPGLAATSTATATPSPVPATATPSPVPPTATPSPMPSPTPPRLLPTATPTTASARPVELAYVVYEGGGHTLTLARVAGLEVQRTEPLVWERAAGPAWSPDGRRIAFVGEVGIEHVLENAPGGSGVWLYDLATQELRLLAEVGGLNYVSWAPDGSLIAYESTQDTGQARTFFMDLNGETQPGHIQGEQPAWSPAGDRLIVKACRPSCGLWSTTLDDGDTHQVTEGGTDSFPHWWGDQLLYASEQAGNWDIYQVTVDETGRPQDSPQRLTTDPAQDITPVYAPDGKQIYFRSSRGGQWAIWLMAPDGGSPQRLLVTGGSEAWARERLVVRAAAE